MQTVTTLALGKFTSPTTFEAQCSECLDPIGSFKITDLLQAIDANKFVGGIKCTSCRKQSCYFCGMPLGGIMYPNKHIGRVMTSKEKSAFFTGYVEICKLCYCDNWEVITDEVPF